MTIFNLKFFICFYFLTFPILAIGAEKPPYFERIEVLEEQENTLEFNDVLNAKNWQTITPPLFSGGYSKKARWLKLTFIAQKNEPLILTVLFATHDDVRLYAIDELVDKSANIAPIETDIANWQYWQQGDLFPFSQREVDWRGFSFALRSPDSLSHTVYLRLSSNESHLLYLQIWKPIEFWTYHKNEFGLFCLVIGWMMLFLLLAIIAWFFTHKAALQRYYVLLAISGIFYFLAADGFLAQSVTMLPLKVISISVEVAAACVQISTILVMRELLLGTERRSLLYWIQSGFMLLGFATAVLSMMGYYGKFLAELFIINNIGCILFSVALGCRMWLKKELPSDIFVTYIIILIDYLIPSVGYLGLAMPVWLSLYGIEIGTFFNLAMLLVITLHNAYQKVRQQQNIIDAAQLQAQASQSQRYWLTMVTHELKTPLAIIHSSCQNIEMLSTNSLIQSRVEKIKRSSIRIDTLVQRFLRNDEIVARLDHLQRQSIPLKYWLKKQLKLFDETAQQRFQLKIETDLVVFADKSLLAIALNNLLTNSLKYSQENFPIEINVQAHTRQNKKGVLIFVKDYGTPIDDEKRDFLFKRYQFNEYAGNGIGLWACREIVCAHQGDVWLEEIAELNSNIFNIWLPK